MRIASLNDRAVLLSGASALDAETPSSAERALDIETASGGLFGHRIEQIYDRWDEFASWAATAPTDEASTFDPEQLGSPSPAPRQIIAFGLNYRDHAAESGIDAPEDLPPVFTKYVSAMSGPNTTVSLPDGHVDWEVELTLVIGRTAHKISEAEAWDHLAGVTVAQDLSERVLQMSGPAPQFSLGKSYPGFLPLGPALVTIDELTDRDALHLTADINGEVVQQGNSRDMIMPVATLIARLSQVLTLYPGDVILTGTPAGVGMGRSPQRFLADGDILTSSIAGIGTMRQRFTSR